MDKVKKVSIEVLNELMKITRWCVKNNNHDFSCFVDYSGHTQQVDITIHKKGYENDSYAERDCIYLTPDLPYRSEEDIILSLKNLHKEIKQELKDSLNG